MIIDFDIDEEFDDWLLAFEWKKRRGHAGSVIMDSCINGAGEVGDSRNLPHLRYSPKQHDLDLF